MKCKLTLGSLYADYGTERNTWYLIVNEYFWGKLQLNYRGWFYVGDFKDFAYYFRVNVIN